MFAQLPAVDLSVQSDPGVPVRVLLKWPPEEEAQVFYSQAWVVMRREGGVLLVVPELSLDEESLEAHSQIPPEGGEPLVGPYITYTVPLLTMGEDGVLGTVGEDLNVMVVDMSLPGIKDLVTSYPEEGDDLDVIILFGAADPSARPDFGRLMPMIKGWVDGEVFERTAYYSAQEEEPVAASPKAGAKAKASAPGSTLPGKAPAGAKAAAKKHTVASLAQQVEALMSSLPVITDQLAKLASKQDELLKKEEAPADRGFKPIVSSKAAMPVSSFLTPGKGQNFAGLAKMMGPPPPMRASVAPSAPLAPQQTLEEDEPVDVTQGVPEEELGSPMAQALLQQSKVLQAIMSHFHASSTDPMSDLSSTTPTTGIKGTLARERLQRELAAGNGQFFLKVCQQIQRRMSPTAKPVSSLSETSSVSLLAYLERYGGYGQSRELGMIMWSIGHVFDAMAAGETGLAADHLALTAAMVEQASLDANKWQLAWQMRLLDDPPQNLWISRGQSATGSRRPFAPLSAQSWNTVALAYMKEAEVLLGKRTELLSSKASPSEGAPTPKPNPKRRPGRGKGASQAQQSEEAG